MQFCIIQHCRKKSKFLNRYFSRFLTTSDKRLFKTFQLTASAETYLLTREGKGEFASIRMRDNAFWSGILNSIPLKDPMKTYTLRTFFTFVFWIESVIVLCSHINACILGWHFSRMLVKDVIRVLKSNSHLPRYFCFICFSGSDVFAVVYGVMAWSGYKKQ